MRNKGAIIALSVIITLLCLHSLQFTFVSRGVQKDAIAYATNENGRTDLSRKQAYLDSIWNEEVYNFFGRIYTYKDIKEAELNHGLDLQGGMHVTLEVAPEDIIRGKNKMRIVVAFEERDGKSGHGYVKVIQDYSNK